MDPGTVVEHTMGKGEESKAPWAKNTAFSLCCHRRLSKERLNRCNPCICASDIYAFALALLCQPAHGTSTSSNCGFTTWWHDEHVREARELHAEEHGLVRRSPLYDVYVSAAATTPVPDMGENATCLKQPAFTYMSLPRSGRGKSGYSDEDGAEFAASMRQTMSWSSFLYRRDVDVDVHFHGPGSGGGITIRPARLASALKWRHIDENSVSIRIPYNLGGFRLSVEFNRDIFALYNNMLGHSGHLTEEVGAAEVHRMPRNALLIFADPDPVGKVAERVIPNVTTHAFQIHRPKQGRIANLHTIDKEIIFFEPGIYDMAWNYHAYLHRNVRWVYLAPGAYVKGALQFRDAWPNYKITGFGVLSGENYVYEPDKQNEYRHKDASQEHCHGTCIKMLEFFSSWQPQHLELHGITVCDPPYHSFAVYASKEDHLSKFQIVVSQYKQVGAWYYQTDGIELMPSSLMFNCFIHANDDAIKLYHSNVVVRDVVVWQGSNGPAIQFGWRPRQLEHILCSDIDVVHNSMYWKDVKHNTCIMNAAENSFDKSLLRTASSFAIRNMSLINIRVEGLTLCAMRFFVQSRWESVVIQNLVIEDWNGMGIKSQSSLFTPAVGVGSTRHGRGLLISNYMVRGQCISQSANNWGPNQLGRLDFDSRMSDYWAAVADLSVCPSVTPQQAPDAPDVTLSSVDGSVRVLTGCVFLISSLLLAAAGIATVAS